MELFGALLFGWVLCKLFGIDIRSNETRFNDIVADIKNKPASYWTRNADKLKGKF